MPTAAETLKIWQTLADRGEEGKIPENMRSAFAEARKRGMIKDNRGFIARTLSPQRENFPEIGGGEATPEEALRGEQYLGKDPSAHFDTDKFGNQVIVSKRGTFYINKPGFTPTDITRAMRGTGRAVHQAAPYLAAGAATGGASAIAGISAQGATGLASEAIQQGGNAMQGRQVDTSRLWKTPLFAMAGDAAARAAFAVAGPILTKLFGKTPEFKVTNPDGTLTDDAISSLSETGVTPADFDNMASFELSRLQREGVLTQEQARRYNFFKRVLPDSEPTTAQVTRSADDFQMQQELAKRNTAVRGVLEDQEGQIAKAFDTRVSGAGGVSTGSPISDAVLGKATALDTEISNLYREAREAIPADKNIQLGRFYDTLRAKAPSNQATNGLISSIRGYMREAGLQGGSATTLGPDALPRRVATGTPVSVGQAEALRIELNRLFPNTTREGRAIIRTLKDAIDEDVLTVAGQDYFSRAREAKAAFESGLRPELLSKFDVNEQSLVRDILDNSIRGDDVFQNVALSRSWKPSDLTELKTYLTTGSPQQFQQGAAAWSNLRADTIQWIKEQAFKGPVDASGNQAISRASLESALRRIGRPKLNVILSPEEVSFIDDMVRLSQLREPVRGTALGRGPSAQAIKALEDRLDKYPLVGQIWQAIKDGRQANAMLNPTQQTVRAVTAPAPVPVPPGVRSAVTGGSAAASANAGGR